MSAFNLKLLLRCPACAGVELNASATELSCRRCGRAYAIREERCFFTEPPEDARKLRRARTNPERWGMLRRYVFEYFRDELAGRDPKEVVVDLGTGTSPYRALLSKFERFVGVDFFPYEMVSVVADVTKPLPFRDASCDLVLCSEVLEHIPNHGELIREIARILKSGGSCLGSVPFLWPVHYAPYDFLRYTPFMLERLFREAGFANVSVKGMGRPADVYKNIGDQFFTIHLLETKFSDNRWKHGLMKLASRGLRKLSSASFRLFGPVLRAAPPSSGFALGYAFRAVKRIGE